MGRSRFRSQPELQRTGRRGMATVFWAAVAAVTVAFGVGFAFMASRSPRQELATTYIPQSVPAPQRQAPSAPMPPPAPAAAAKPPAVEVAAAPPTPAPIPPVVRPPSRPLQVATAARTTPPARRIETRAAAPPAPQAEWRRQIEDYERRLEEHSKLERDEGYRWARSNNANGDGSCRDAGRRSREFMEGCFDYLDQAGG